jgi:hypothetical protein
MYTNRVVFLTLLLAISFAASVTAQKKAEVAPKNTTAPHKATTIKTGMPASVNKKAAAEKNIKPLTDTTKIAINKATHALQDTCRTPGKIPIGYRTIWALNPYDTIVIVTHGKQNYRVNNFYWLGLVTSGERLHYELWDKKKHYNNIQAAKVLKLEPVYND